MKSAAKKSAASVKVEVAPEVKAAIPAAVAEAVKEEKQKTPPVLRYAKDNCINCAPKAKEKNPDGKQVKWAATYEDITCTLPIWKCCTCGRSVARKERTR